MITTKFYLDTRSTKSGDLAPLKLSITKHGDTAYVPIGLKLLPCQWDKVHEKVKDCANKVLLNSYLQNQKMKVDNYILQMTADGKLCGMSVVRIKNLIIEMLDPVSTEKNLFISRFKAYMERCKKPRTKQIYHDTMKRVLEFDPKVETLSFDDIGKDWLVRFDSFLRGRNASQNTRCMHFRNLRAVFNDAIDNDITTAYPFRKFMVRSEETAKRAYSVDRLRELFNYPVDSPNAQRFVDMFKLIFFLVGINIVDLYNLRGITNGRIEYRRAKTSRLYSVKVEPEAMDIIERYRGRTHLLNLADIYKSSRTCMVAINKGLKLIGAHERSTHRGREVLEYHPAFPDLSTYVARHTWATIAYELDIPNETIAAALGHSFGNRTTAIYIKNNNRKVDEANRRVIDYVLGNTVE